MSVDDGILDPAHEDNGGIETPPAAAAAVAPPAEHKVTISADGNVAEINGQKYVTHAALTSERAERQKLSGILADLDPVMPEFQQFLKTRNGRQGATVERARGAQTSTDYNDDELEGFAITRGYYKEDQMTPDTARAAKELDIISGISARQARNAVEPVTRSNKVERANANRERARGNKFVDGQPIADGKYLDAAFEAVGEENLADPNVANLVQVVAAGLEYLDHRKNGTLPGRRATGQGGSRREPMMAEGASGRFDGDDGELSPLDIAAARARGKTPEQWQKMSKSINASGRRNTALLEDV